MTLQAGSSSIRCATAHRTRATTRAYVTPSSDKRRWSVRAPSPSIVATERMSGQPSRSNGVTICRTTSPRRSVSRARRADPDCRHRGSSGSGVASGVEFIGRYSRSPPMPVVPSRSCSTHGRPRVSATKLNRSVGRTAAVSMSASSCCLVSERWCPRTRAMRGLLRLRRRAAGSSPRRQSPLFPSLLGLFAMQPACQLATVPPLRGSAGPCRVLCCERAEGPGMSRRRASEMPEAPPVFGRSGPAPDAELRHTSLKGGWGQSEYLRCALGPTNPPSGLLENPHDVGALHVLEHLARRRLRPGLWPLDPQRPLSAQDDRSLDDVPQLADVAGPRVPLQRRQAGLIDAVDPLPHLPPDLVHERPHQQRDVLWPLAQRRHHHREHRQTEVEVGPELAVRHRLLEIAVRRRDAPDVQPHAGGTPEPLR